jgi:heme/copper-type cytochrome/quinol oxidase subunit 1
MYASEKLEYYAKLGFELLRKFTVKKYLYTINHKRLGLNYFYFSLVSAMAGSVLATAIRFEMAYPGSSFFNGDSLKYLQVITAHALIMIFFVVVPIFFGGFANFLLPYHVGSKDVAFPRLNSLGFWIQPCGFLLIAKIGFLRTEFWTSTDKVVNYFYNLSYSIEKNNQITINNESVISLIDAPFEVLAKLAKDDKTYTFKFVENLIDKNTSGELKSAEFINNAKKVLNTSVLSKLRGEVNILELDENIAGLPWRLFLWKLIYIIPETMWFLINNATYIRRRKRYITKCSNASQTVAGWTFITPFSSKLKFTGAGIQDMLILGVYFAGISTTISLVNLLATRRCLSMPGLRNRRVLLSFITISILLMFRALAVITPVLGSAMLMLALDRHWKTSFFDFAYGGDPIFFHHLFWFFGHPEVYVLVIPAFGIVNAVLPTVNMRRVASKHHLIWAIYIMNYMGFLVWGHHMYLIGLDHRSRALYSTITIMISMPATIKVVNWTFTLLNGALRKDTVLFAILSFIFFFLVAGFTGMWLSHVSLNISMHDTLYVVAHFHLMLSGAVLMGIFVGFYFYFTSFFQVKYSKIFSYIHIIYYTGGQWMTFLPLFWVSFSGLPRRLHDYPAMYMGWQSMATVGHLVTMIGVIAFYTMLIESHVEKKTTVFLYHIVARFNKRITYYLYKYLHIYLFNKNISLLPNKTTNIYITDTKSLYSLYI